MKLKHDSKGTPAGVESEGKILEIIPVIEIMGQPYVLPPVQYHVENWLLGFRDDHPTGTPATYYFHQKIYLMGSNSNAPNALTFMVRVLEDGSEGPADLRNSITTEAVNDIVNAFKAAAEASKAGN